MSVVDAIFIACGGDFERYRPVATAPGSDFKSLENFTCPIVVVQYGKAKMFHIDTKHPTPLYHQLERAIKFAIATGKLAIGDQLPTVRQLAVDLRINANTVARVYGELERAGVLETRRGVGTFVHDRPGEAVFNRRERERHLRELTDHFIAETHTRGFSIDEVIEHLKTRRKRSAN